MNDARQPLNKSAIAAGFGTDIVATLISLVPISAGMFVMMTMRGKKFDLEQIDQWNSDPAFLAIGFCFGVLTLALAGYVSGRLARRDHVRHAAWTGLTLLVFYAVLNLIPSEGEPEPLWYTGLTLLSTVPATMVGGYFAARTPARKP